MRVVYPGAAIPRPEQAILNPQFARREPVLVIRPGSEEGHSETTSEAKLLDQSVRAHEERHRLALGPYAASAVQLTTRRGADGEPIAVGGSIKADLTPVPGNPRATLRKANSVRNAALSVGSPSVADQRVAAEAYRLAQGAREQLEAARLDTRA
jgi:hypothetical protein